MSKKTRQQKILADLRRQLAQEQSQKSSAPEVSRPEYSFKPNVVSPVVATSRSADKPLSVMATDYTYVKNDLLKTSILTVLAIGAQLVLWYVLNRR